MSTEKDEIWIPDEIIQEIESYLPTNDLINAKYVSKQWMTVSNNSSWENRFHTDFLSSKPPKEGVKNFQLEYFNALKKSSTWLKHFISLSSLHFIFKILFQDQKENSEPERILKSQVGKYNELLNEKIHKVTHLIDYFIILYCCLLFNHSFGYFSYFMFLIFELVVDTTNIGILGDISKCVLVFVVSYFNSLSIFQGASSIQIFFILMTFIFLISFEESVPYVIVDETFRNLLFFQFKFMNYSSYGHYAFLGIYFGFWGSEFLYHLKDFFIEILILLIVAAIFGGKVSGKLSKSSQCGVFILTVIGISYFFVTMIAISAKEKKVQLQFVLFFLVVIGLNLFYYVNF
jgi:hypothetical protein